MTGGLSPAQAHLWELENRLGASGMHVFALAYQLEGPLDVQHFVESIAAVAERHQALHTRVAVDNGRPSFESVMPPSLVVRSFTCPRNDGGDARLDAALKTEAARPIDVRNGAGWRAVLLERSAESHTLLVQFHHLVADRWSVGVFMTDVAIAFRNIMANRPPFDGEPALGAPVAREIPPAQLAFWQNRFALPAATLELPSARPLQTFSDYAGSRIESVIGPDRVVELQQLAVAESAPLFSLLLAAFAAMLHAHTRQDDLVVCTPMSGRHCAEARGAIGYFNNIVPLRLDLGGNPTFRELVARVTAGVREAAANQDVPFHVIASLPELASSRITRCLFAMQEMPGLHLDLPGVDVRYRDVPNGTANFDLALVLEEVDGRVDVLVDHKTTVLDTTAVTSLQTRFLEVLDRVAAQPGLQLCELPAYPSGQDESTSSRSAIGGYLPRNLLEQRMVEIWRNVFPGAEINGNSHFCQLGGDSMRAARLFTLIEKEFGHQLPIASLIEAPTPRHLARQMRSAKWAFPWLSLVPIKTTGTRPPLFCVHGGDDALSFTFIGDALRDDQPLYSLQGSESASTSVEEMAEQYVESVRRLFPKGPYLFAGHALGAAVAFEMAQLCVAAGDRVVFLGLFDHPGPKLKRSWRAHIPAMTNRVSSSLKRITRMSGSAGSTPSATLLNYEVKPYSGRVTLFRARNSSPRIHSDPLGGWGEVAGGGVDVIEVPGTHDSMFEQPHVVALGEAISHCIARLDTTE
ncbi:MAG: condensation domain-containing protein [Gemmatimonadaceae bacterium]